MPAFWTGVGAVFYLIKTLERRCPRQLHVHRTFRAGWQHWRTGHGSSLSQAGALPYSQSPTPDRRSLSAISYRWDCFSAESSVNHVARQSGPSVNSKGTTAIPLGVEMGQDPQPPVLAGIGHSQIQNRSLSTRAALTRLAHAPIRRRRLECFRPVGRVAYQRWGWRLEHRVSSSFATPFDYPELPPLIRRGRSELRAWREAPRPTDRR